LVFRGLFIFYRSLCCVCICGLFALTFRKTFTMKQVFTLVMVLFCLNIFSQGFKSFYSPLNSGYFISAVNHPDLGTVIATETQAWGQGGKEILVFRLDTDDDVVWQKCYGNGIDNSVTAMDTIAGGDYILGGADWNGTNGNIFLLRIDDMGDTVWTKTMKASDWDNVTCSHLKTFDSTSFVMVGYGGDMLMPNTTYISKLSNNGVAQWAYTLENSTYSAPWELYVSNGFTYLLAYQTNSFAPGVDIIKFDAIGHIVWQYRYTKTGFFSMGLSLIGVGNSDLVFSGYTQNSSSGSDNKAFYTRIDSSGNIIWAKEFKNNLTVKSLFGWGTATDVSGNIFGTGQYENAIFCAKIDQATGNLLQQHAYDPGTVNRGNLVLVKPSSTVWIGSTTNPTTGVNNPVVLRTDIDANNPCSHLVPELMYGPMTWTRSMDSLYTVPFVLNDSITGYSIGSPVLHDSVFCSTIGINEPIEETCLDLYPNPGHGNFNIHSCENIQHVMIYDMHGSCVYNQRFNHLDIQLSGAVIPKGIYAVVIETTKGRYSKKWVVE